jgi:hypothetical protein
MAPAIAAVVALALTGTPDPTSGCEIYAHGSVERIVQCPGDVFVLLEIAPQSVRPEALLETIIAGGRSPELRYEPTTFTVGGKKRTAYRAMTASPQSRGRVGYVVALEGPADTRVVTCLAPTFPLVEAHCPALFEFLVANTPTATHVENATPAPYTARVFGGEPALPDGCSFESPNSIVCSKGQIFWGRLRAKASLDDLLKAMREAVPKELEAHESERDCTVGGAATKCHVTTFSKGAGPASAIILADVELDSAPYRVECRVAQPLSKGPAPVPCQQVIRFTTEMKGDEEPRDATVIVFNRALPAGATVALSDVSQRKVPRSLASTSVVTVDKVSHVAGQRLVQPVDESDPALWTMFEVERSEPCAAPDAKNALQLEGASSPYESKGTRLREIIVAARDLAVGTVLKLDDLSARSYRSDLVGKYIADSSAVKRVVGQRVMDPIQAGDPIRLPSLAGYPNAVNRCAAKRKP